MAMAASCWENWGYDRILGVYIFDERGPEEELRLQFEAIGRFTADEKKLVRELLDSLILKHEAKRWTA